VFTEKERQLLDMIEAFADGTVTEDEMHSAARYANSRPNLDVYDGNSHDPSDYGWEALQLSAGNEPEDVEDAAWMAYLAHGAMPGTPYPGD
jgi:hypothetical protein